MTMQIAVVQSNVNGRWGYCPVAAMRLLKLEYDDEAPYLTADEAREAAQRDRSIGKRARFSVHPSPVQTPAKRYEVQTWFHGDHWENVWTDGEGAALTFETREEAEQAIRDHLHDMGQGYIEQPETRDDFRIAEVQS